MSDEIRRGGRRDFLRVAGGSAAALALVAAGALVGDRRVDVAVGDDHPAGLQRRGDHRVDVVSLVGRIQERLGPR